MENKKAMKKVVSLLIVGGIVLSLSASAFASTADSSSANSTAKQTMERGHGPRTEAKDFLNTLVQKGIITQAEADKWAAYDQQQADARKAEMEKVKNMTEAERHAYFSSKQKQEPKNRLSELVAAGIISQDQADQIAKLMPAKQDKDAAPGAKSKEFLSNLVQKGIISQDEADKWVAFEQNKFTERKAEMEKVKNMTEAERQAYFADKQKQEPKNPLDELVAAGIITQDQADQIAKLMPAKH